MLLQVHVHLCGGDFYRNGEVCAYDFHYDLATIRFSFIPPSGRPKVARTSGSTDVHLSRTTRPSFRFLTLSRSYKLTSRNSVLVMGRYFSESSDIMIGPGE